jgi:AraC-like DNA-binding protein/quercetin dioxygenase-like cupin family protein
MKKPDPYRKHVHFHQAGHGMAAMEADWPDGRSTGWHSHPRGQLLHAIEGVMLVDSSAGSWVVPPNRALWLTAGVRHCVRMSGDVKMRTLYIDAAEIGGLPDRTCVVNVSPLLRELIVAAVRVPVEYEPDSRDERLMRLLIDEVRASDILPLHLPIPSDARVKSICETLIGNPADASTAAQWGERLGVTAKTVHRLFAQETGMTFAQWRDQARLLVALRRIAQGERIIDIAFECGYASQSAFTAMFRRHFGVPPSSFHR